MVLEDKTHRTRRNAAPEYAGASSGTGPAGEDHLPYWREQLAGVTAVRFPGDQSASRAGGPRATSGFEVPADLTARLRDLMGEHGLSSLDLMVTALAVVLARYTNREDIPVATAATPSEPAEPGPHGRAPADGGQPGNVVVLRCRVTESASLLDVLLRVHRTVTEALAHSPVPFDVLAQELGLGRELVRAVVLDSRTAAPPAADIAVRLRTGEAELAGVVECRHGASGPPTPGWRASWPG